MKIKRMGFEGRYWRAKGKFLKDRNICSANKDLYSQYLQWQERKLKSINALRELDEGCYKTLYHYICMFKNINKWFCNKPLKNITKQDIKKVYEELEDGVIKNFYGKPFEDRASYYSKIFKGKLFKMIGKYEYADEVLEFSRPEKNKGKVRFFTKEDFDKMNLVTKTLSHKLLLNLCWDIGENIMTILQLQKKDCRRTINSETNEPEYLINLPRGKIKRSRTARTEPANYTQTVELLDMFFEQGKRIFAPDPNGENFQTICDEDKIRRKIKGYWKTAPFEPDDYLFDFGHKQAEKVFRRIVTITGVKCHPDAQRPTLKDLRSSMACHLLAQGWTVEEVKARMGHKPSSNVIDKYITFLAIDKNKPKRRMYESELKKYQCQLEESQQREKMYSQWIHKQKNEVAELKSLMKNYISKQNQLEQMQIHTHKS